MRGDVLGPGSYGRFIGLQFADQFKIRLDVGFDAGLGEILREYVEGAV